MSSKFLNYRSDNLGDVNYELFNVILYVIYCRLQLDQLPEGPDMSDHPDISNITSDLTLVSAGRHLFVSPQITPDKPVSEVKSHQQYTSKCLIKFLIKGADIFILGTIRNIVCFICNKLNK